MLVILTDGKTTSGRAMIRRRCRGRMIDGVVKEALRNQHSNLTIGVGDKIDADALKKMVFPRGEHGAVFQG